jgi:hypothetical protein
MKKLVLLFTGLLIGLTTVTAAEKNESASQGEDLTTNRYNFIQPIQFIERGVEFLIFPDGTFDFNTHIEDNHYNNGYDEGYYRKSNTKRRAINTTFGAPGTRVNYSRPRSRGTIITHDASGKVRRIGNVFVNYNRIGQVKRLGSVYIRYNRSGLITQVGGLHLKYNKRGQVIRLIGQVNYNNQGCGICGVASCSMNHFDYSNQYDNDWDNQWSNDDDHYYYKKSGKVKKQKKLKRRK